MARIFRKITLVFVFQLMFGCASLPTRGNLDGEPDSTRVAPVHKEAAPEMVYVTNLPEVQNAEIVTLECKAAHRLGCRYKGRVYPWNAWVDMKGYKASAYSIQDVQKSGNRAVVKLVKQ